MRELELAIVGHTSYNREVTPLKEKTIIDGGAYSAAIGASIVSNAVGFVTQVGSDFDLSLLKERGINIDGVKVVNNGKTPFFTTYQHQDGTRTFLYSDIGLAAEVNTSTFPDNYHTARYVYLATLPPSHHIRWIQYLKFQPGNLSGNSKIAVNAFEKFVKDHPDETKSALLRADIIFLNEEELRMLRNYGVSSFTVPLILTKGNKGAVYIDGTETITIPAPRVNTVDTTGAGDILAGVFLALRAKEITINKALEQAVNIASQSVTDFGIEHINPLPKQE